MITKANLFIERLIAVWILQQYLVIMLEIKLDLKSSSSSL